MGIVVTSIINTDVKLDENTETAHSSFSASVIVDFYWEYWDDVPIGI